MVPEQVCEALKKENISYYKTGIEHGTITAEINGEKFEITSLRQDVFTDGRHAKVKFSTNWKDDSLRRDFTINSIYSDSDGNLFDPHNGKKDLEDGLVNFIGDADQRIKEDYLRILRYLRFFINYSKNPHDTEIIKKLKMNIDGVSKLSKERLLDELKKIIQLSTIERLSKDKISLELFSIIFPELKDIKIFSNLDRSKKMLLQDEDFIFFLSLMIIDDTDNTDYFLYKFNLSKKDQKRIKVIHNFYKEKTQKKIFTENSMNTFFYYNGKLAVTDILKFKLIKSKKNLKIYEELIKLFETKSKPIMPINADMLMTKYKVPEGKELGDKLKLIENEWVNNNFQISDTKLENIINN